MNKRNHKGFTLAELLVAVAIIAVLVSLAIPMFTKQLEQARESQDINNMRDAYALFDAYTRSNTKKINGKKAKEFTASNPCYYDGDDITTTTPTTPLGKGTTQDGGSKEYYSCSDEYYDNTKDYTNSVLVCWYDTSDETIHVHWMDIGNLPSGGDTTDGGKTTNIGGFEFKYTELPSKITESTGSIKIKQGYLYMYNNVIYVALGDFDNCGIYYCSYINGTDYVLKQPTGTIIYPSQIDTNTNQLYDVHYGDIYKDGNDYWFRKSDSTHADPPTTNSQEWIKIVSQTQTIS